jgi:hypothetical protein
MNASQLFSRLALHFNTTVTPLPLQPVHLQPLQAQAQKAS